jgi:anti-sigma B factor antagonist
MHTTREPPVGSDWQALFPSPLFAITATSEGDSYVICVEGELDLSECSRFESALREAEASPATRILLDLDELAFIDAAGLGVLVAAWRRSAVDGNRLQVTRGGGSVANMLRLTALDTVLPFVGETS